MSLADRAVELAEALLREARAEQTPDERAQARKLARMMADPHGKELTIALAEQAFRSPRPARAGPAARPHEGGSARQGAHHRAGGPGLPQPPAGAHRRPARLPAG